MTWISLWIRLAKMHYLCHSVRKIKDKKCET
jgi:hypothetical protein